MKRTSIKSTLLVFVFFLSTQITSFAQAGFGISDLFSSASGALTFPGAPVPANVAFPAGSQDDYGASFNIGATIRFNGINYTQCVVSSNGWISLLPTGTVGAPGLGAVPASLSAAGYLSTNALNNNTSGFPIIAPFWDDNSSTGFSWVVSGGSLWIRTILKMDKTSASNVLVIVRIDANGTVALSYPATTTLSATASGSIGIAGPCVGDYYSYDAPNFKTYADSLTEISNINVASAIANKVFIFTPYQWYDNCASAKDLLNVPVSGCTNTTININNALTSGGAQSCATTDSLDVWVKFTKPIGMSSVTVTTSNPGGCQPATGTTVTIYSACGTPIGGSCATTGPAASPFAEASVSRGPCANEVLYARITNDGSVGGKFNICVKDGGAAGSTGLNCSNPTWICAIPYTSPPGSTTAGSGNDYDSATVCHTPYLLGEDYVFAYTPPANGCIKIDLTTANSRPGLFIYDDCPDVFGAHCLGSSELSSGSPSITAMGLIGGVTYYIVVDNDPTAGNPSPAFTLNVTNGSAVPIVYDDCATAKDLGAINNGITCTPQTYSTLCALPSPAAPTPGAPPPPGCIAAGPIPSFIDGTTGDMWLKFNATYSGTLQISMSQSATLPTMTQAGMALYTGTCGSLNPPIACADNGGALGMPAISITVTLGTTYYIRVWAEHPTNEGNFDICFTSACAPPNDLPCQAINVPTAGIVHGQNACATHDGTKEPPNEATCAPGGGTNNSVWYKTTVPATGCIDVKLTPSGSPASLDPQIKAWRMPSNDCNLASTAVNNGNTWCNHLGGGCNGGFSVGSELQLTGLTPGEVIYIAVDGVGSTTGQFDISVTDCSASQVPPSALQDCGGAVVVCSPADIVNPDPGVSGTGNVCDLSTNAPCFSYTERNSSWYQFTVDPAAQGGTATVSFDIRSASTVDVDFVVWDITNRTDPCKQLHDNPLYPAAACNGVNSQDSTGCKPTGAGGSDPYSPSIVFSDSVRTFMMLVNVFNLTGGGTTIHWEMPIAIPKSVTWTGTLDNIWNASKITNWGSCGPVPTCDIDANIAATPNGNQPTITAGTMTVKNITIQGGATLTLAPGTTLQVCGNFVNNGNLVCGANSTIEFVGPAAQTISGFLTGPNKFWNLKITKIAGTGSVQLLNDADVNGNFTTTNISSIFDINKKYMKVGGNFSNASGATTFTGIGASTIEFDSTVAQTFTNSAGSITLNNVVMNKPSNNLSLSGASSIMNIDSLLTLTSGRIVTRALPALEVNVKWASTAAVTGYNLNSYVDGTLRRKIYSSGAGVMGLWDFPVGIQSATAGYNNASVNFTSATTISDLAVTFYSWSALQNGPVSSECAIANYSLLADFNNGYWGFKKTSAINTGNYDITLNNFGETNNVGNGWTVSYADIAANPNSAAWGLLGTCVLTSTPPNVGRSNLNPGATPLTSFNHYYTTSQTAYKLPLELLYFTADPKGEEVICAWETSSEINNDYFEVERSSDGINFIDLAQVKGFGNGTSTETRKYSYVDHNTCDDIRYYRLKQVDINGDHTFSSIVAINCRKNSGVEVFPNPANSKITYQFYYPESTELTLDIMDISGRIVLTEKISVQKGINQLTSSIETLAAGVYNLRINSPERGMLQKQFFKN